MFKEATYNYDETDILKDQNRFFDEILSKSFENEKLIIITGVTNKIINIIDDLITRKIKDIKIILLADKLDKKSKLRLLFEKKTISLYSVLFR